MTSVLKAAKEIANKAVLARKKRHLKDGYVTAGLLFVRCFYPLPLNDGGASLWQAVVCSDVRAQQ